MTVPALPPLQRILILGALSGVSWPLSADDIAARLPAAHAGQLDQRLAGMVVAGDLVQIDHGRIPTYARPAPALGGPR